MKAQFVINNMYYTGEVYEFNLPTGITCPAALECKVTVDLMTGIMEDSSTRFKCYAASAERYPSVRKHLKNCRLITMMTTPEYLK